MPMSQEVREAAEARVRKLLGINRKGSKPGALPMPPRAGSPLSVTASTKRALDDEIYGLQQYGYGEVWGRPGLTIRERSFITMGILAGTRQSDQLGIHGNNALNLGITPEEISEILVHVGVYAGGSVWHEASNVVRYVFIERGVLEPGAGVTLVPAPPTTREQRRDASERVRREIGAGRMGTDAQAPRIAPLAGRPASITSAETLPIEAEIIQIQLEYGYGEVWSRPALGYRTRSLITVAVLQALRLDDQLHTHVNIALNLGITPTELHEVFLHTGVYSGVAGWQNATNVARDVFLKRGILEA